MKDTERKNKNRVENMKHVNLKRRARSHAIIFFLRVLDNMGNLNEVMWFYNLKHLPNENRRELWHSFCDLPNIGKIEKRQIDNIEFNEHSLNSYRADQVLKLMGINFNKGKLKIFSGNGKQNKELTQLVLSTVKSDPAAYRKTLDLFIKYWIVDYELRAENNTEN